MTNTYKKLFIFKLFAKAFQEQGENHVSYVGERHLP
jgi:hypothetical protein